MHFVRTRIVVRLDRLPMVHRTWPVLYKDFPLDSVTQLQSLGHSIAFAVSPINSTSSWRHPLSACRILWTFHWRRRWRLWSDTFACKKHWFEIWEANVLIGSTSVGSQCQKFYSGSSTIVCGFNLFVLRSSLPRHRVVNDGWWLYYTEAVLSTGQCYLFNITNWLNCCVQSGTMVSQSFSWIYRLSVQQLETRKLWERAPT